MYDNQASPQVPLVPMTKTSTLAIISLVMGIVTWLILPIVGAFVAVITGHMAKKEIRTSSGHLTGDGLATAGLVLGYLQIILVVVPLLFCCVLSLLGPAIGNVFSEIIGQI